MEKYVDMEYLPKQGRFMRNCREVPFSGYIGGFGSGKTHTLILQSLNWVQGDIPSRGLIGAPTYKMLEDTTQRKFFDLLPEGWLRSFTLRRNVAVLANGTEVFFRSLENPGRLAGLELDWSALDEIGEVKEDTFKMLIGRGRSKAAGIRKLCGVGNPAGPAHWSYTYFVTLAKKYPNKFRLVQATSYENTYNPADYVENMTIAFGKGTPYYRRYVLGQFVAFEGAYWTNFNTEEYPEGHVLEVEDTLLPLKGPLVWGKVVDFGFEHPFVCLWWVTDGQRIVFHDEYHQRHGLIKWHCLNIRMHEEQHQRQFGAHVRPTSAWTDHEAVSRAEIEAAKDDEGNSIGFSCIPTEKCVMEQILLVQTLFGQDKLFITKKCENTLLEIPSYRAKEGVVGEEPVREKDDTCACLRYATWMEMQHLIPWKRHDTGSTIPDDIFEGAVAEWPTEGKY